MLTQRIGQPQPWEMFQARRKSGTFALVGPEKCGGLPFARYNAVIEVGRSENASMVSKTATSRLAMVFPPAETEVPDPVNTTPFGDQRLKPDAPLLLINASQQITNAAAFDETHEFVFCRSRRSRRHFSSPPAPSRKGLTIWSPLKSFSLSVTTTQSLPPRRQR